MLVKVLDKIEKTICIENFDDTEILIYADDKLPNNIIFVIFCDINDVCCKK